MNNITGNKHFRRPSGCKYGTDVLIEVDRENNPDNLPGACLIKYENKLYQSAKS